jgi:hypothetical protein
MSSLESRIGWRITSKVSLRTLVAPSIRLRIPSSIPLLLIDDDVFPQAPGEVEAELAQLTARSLIKTVITMDFDLFLFGGTSMIKLYVL